LKPLCAIQPSDLCQVDRSPVERLR
jgi:hypothetical protein